MNYPKDVDEIPVLSIDGWLFRAVPLLHQQAICYDDFNARFIHDVTVGQSPFALEAGTFPAVLPLYHGVWRQAFWEMCLHRSPLSAKRKTQSFLYQSKYSIL